MVRRKSHKLLITLICFVFLIMGFSAGYYINMVYLKNAEKDNNHIKPEKDIDFQLNDERNNNDMEIVENTAGQVNHVAEASENEEDKIVLSTQITLKEKYLQCNHEISKDIPVSEEFIGLTQKEFEKLNPQWEIRNFSADEILIYMEVDDKCPTHYLVKQYDGKVGIFYAGSYKKNQLKQVLNININQLRQEDRKNIINGIEINSDKELAQLIEDLTS